MRNTTSRLMKRITALTLALVMMLSAVVTVQAAPNYKTKYTPYLGNYFLLKDINRDGVKELFTATASYAQDLKVYTIKNGKVKLLGSYNNKYYSCVKYNKKRHGFLIANGGSGAAGDDLMKIKNGRLVVAKSYMMVIRGDGTSYYVDGKKTTLKKWKSTRKKYFATKNIKSLFLVSNTSQNRSRYLK